MIWNIVLVGSLLVVVALLTWSLVKTKKELASEKERHFIAQFETYPYISKTTGNPQKIEATVALPPGVQADAEIREVVLEELRTKLSTALQQFWTIKKEMDFDCEFFTGQVRYKATVWVLPKEGE